MAVQRPRSQSSIVLTLKVLQFVKQLRRRLKPRLQSPKYPSCLGAETCLGLESKAFRALAKGLSRVGLQDRKQLNRASDRVCKSRNKQRSRPTLKLQTAGQDGPAIQNLSGGEVQHMLNAIDDKLSPSGSALSAIASNDRLFLKQNAALNLEAYSLNETVQSLIVVHDAINVLYACRSQYDDEWLVAQGRDAGLNFDDAFIANYEHLLLRLRAQLLEALARKVLEALLLGGHDKTQRRLLSWFTEFSDKPRPLSTFPWTIKPSLAVLWGVCWMFYDRSGRPTTEAGNLRVPQASVLQNVELSGWGAPGSTDYLNFGLQLTGTLSQPAAQQQLAGNSGNGVFGGVDLRLRNADTLMPAATNLESVLQPRQGASRAAAQRSNRQDPGLSTYYPQFPAGLEAEYANLHLLPSNLGSATLQVYPQQIDLDSFEQSWHLPHSSLPQRTTRHLTTNIPSVRVTGSADNEGFAAPHPDFASYTNIFPPPTQEPEDSPLYVNTNFPDFVNMGNCQPPETTPVLALQGPTKHERTSSVNSNTNMPTPVSLSGTRSPLLSPVGDRRASIASSHGHFRHPSEDRSSIDGDDALSPRNRAYKRAEEPPKNTEGKMVCKHHECTGLTFDRKCEWSKHMDKHDRPYKCNVKGCEKLQGFTYSGGLLRHEREVHKMHGGTKKSLFCPFTDCKRSSGSGFTRKENLAEHIRRVHRRTSMSADLGHLIIQRSDIQDEANASQVRLASEPFERIPEAIAKEEAQPGTKRKRISEAGLSEEGDDNDMRAEIKRLRRENEEKDTRLRQLEAAVMALQQGRR